VLLHLRPPGGHVGFGGKLLGTGASCCIVTRVLRLFLAKESDESYRGREREQLELFPFTVVLFPVLPFLVNPYYTKMNITRIKILFFVLFL
jgi:hypothetical protein